MRGGMKCKIIIPLVIIIFMSIFYLREKFAGDKENVDKGQSLYNRHCMSCHGEKGDGNGIFAKYIFPKPRDFTRGVYKLRSTPSGKVPTDMDLLNTIRNGVPGTAMISFSFLSEDELKSIVEFIKTFAKKCVAGKCIDFFEVRKAQPIKLPAKLEKTNELLILGKKFYKEVECWKCHGEKGKGDGPQAGEQKDSWGNPIKVRDFTKGVYLGGNTEEDLVKRFLTGMDGTPMPSFVESIEKMIGADSEKHRQLIWGLVYYVKSLEEKNVRIAKPPQDATIYLSKVSDDFNFTIDAKEWENTKTYEIPVNRLWQGDENYKILYVKGMYNSNKLAILVEYEDKTEDTRNYAHTEFQDMVAIQFSHNEKPPFIGMGDKDSSVSIWLFKPNWQMSPDYSKRIYPNLANDLPFTEIIKKDKETFYTSKAVGNLQMGGMTSSIENLYAHGAQTAESQSTLLQNIEGKGVWSDGNWRVIFVRKLRSNNKNDIQIQTGKKIPIAFAIWDGSQFDRDGQKLISSWYYLYLK